MEYPVMKDATQIGNASVEGVGLYLEIQCLCSNLEDGFYRLLMVFADKTIILGLLVREGEYYVTKKRIPVKSAGIGEPEFLVVSKETELLQEHSVRLVQGKMVENLSMIKTGKLAVKDGNVHLVFSSLCHRVLPDQST